MAGTLPAAAGRERQEQPHGGVPLLYDRMAHLKQAIEKGDTLGTREELARWQGEFNKKQCGRYDY